MTVAIPEPVEPLDPALAAAVKARFDKGEACGHCGGIHARKCPRVRRLDFHPNAALASVRFWRDGKWSDDGVIWPEDVHQPPSSDGER